MSATKRGGQRSPADDYPTPSWCVDRLLENPDIKASLPTGLWLEPAAGEGAIIKASRAYYPEVLWDAVELREECRPALLTLEDVNVTIGSFLEQTDPSHYAVCITNPPFSLAAAFIDRAFLTSDWVVMLLRLNYMSSMKRHPVMKRYCPDLYILPNRPSFKGTGETDSIEYAWFVWPPDRERRSGMIQVLGLTPESVRTTKQRKPRQPKK